MVKIMTDYEKLKEKVGQLVVDQMDFTRDMSEAEILAIIDDILTGLSDRSDYTLSEILSLRKEVYNSLRKYDVIQEYLDDDTVTEIMINGCEDIFIEKDGKLIKTEKSFASKEKLDDVIQQMVGACNRTVNEAHPIADARLLTGERICIVLNPISLNGSSVTIRRFPTNPITMEKLIEYGSLTQEASDFLKALVFSKYNIFISGGTGSGKTTFLNALSQFIPPKERIVTIEDSAELKLLKAENLVRLETRNSNTSDCTPINIRDLIKASLRMRPDRIIVGEVRGAEAVDMLQAMNTGHDGSLSTGHANSSKDMLARLETMVISGMDIPLYSVRSQIAGGIDIFIHLGRLRNGKRVVLEISEVEGFFDGEIKLHKLYERVGNELLRTGTLINNRKLLEAEDGLQGIQI